MVWIAVSIIVVGYFIVRAINNTQKPTTQQLRMEQENREYETYREIDDRLIEGLKKRTKEVHELVKQGLTDKQIAAKLNTTEKMVKLRRRSP